jgi:hypothetical protein
MEIEKPRPRDLIQRLRQLERLSVKGEDRKRPRVGSSISGLMSIPGTGQPVESVEENGRSVAMGEQNGKRYN